MYHLRAMPASVPPSVPQPTGAPDTACRQRRPASPRRCVGCAPYSRVRRQPHGLEGLSYPLSRHRCWGSSSVGCGRSTTMASRVASNSLASCTFAPATTMLKGPPSPSTRRLRLVPALPRSVGLGPIRSPKNVPCPWLRLPPAIPSPRHPTLRTPPPGLPTFGARRPSPPTVERCDEWCCRPQALSAIGSIGTRCAAGR